MSSNIKLPTINYTIFLSNHKEVSTLYFPSKKTPKVFQLLEFFLFSLAISFNYESQYQSSSSLLRRLATNPKPVKPSINPRSPDFTDCFSPVFGNSCLDLVVVSCGRELVDPLVLVDSEVLTDVLVLIVSEALVVVETDVLADALIESDVIILAMSRLGSG